jgi:circadian clock protein KaiC
MDRCEGLGLPLGGAIEQGLVTVEQLDAGQLSPGAFVRHVQEAVEQRGARTIVIDSVNGFLNAMGEERLVLIQLHELLTYLGERGVLTILTVAQHGLLGDHTQSPLDVSYLADTVVLLRFFESAGEVRGAISVLKKRVGGHERSIREIAFGPGITVGGVLRDFEGVMSGTPRFMGSPSELMDRGDE